MRLNRFVEEILTVAAELDTESPTDEDILRLGIAAELQAILLYERLARLAQNEDVKEVLLDVVREEKVHVGEFQYLLEHVDVEELATQGEGEEEVEDDIMDEE